MEDTNRHNVAWFYRLLFLLTFHVDTSIMHIDLYTEDTIFILYNMCLYVYPIVLLLSSPQGLDKIMKKYRYCDIYLLV
jgi:hypothetical protein